MSSKMAYGDDSNWKDAMLKEDVSLKSINVFMEAARNCAPRNVVHDARKVRGLKKHQVRCVQFQK